MTSLGASEDGISLIWSSVLCDELKGRCSQCGLMGGRRNMWECVGGFILPTARLSLRSCCLNPKTDV